MYSVYGAVSPVHNFFVRRNGRWSGDGDLELTYFPGRGRVASEKKGLLPPFPPHLTGEHLSANVVK